jgi:retron-type reverse transcriptase
LDADIEKCFDKISHQYLINKLNTISMFKHQNMVLVKSWDCGFYRK